MKIIAAVLFVALATAGLARAEDALIERKSFPITCSTVTKRCEVAIEDMAEIRDMNEGMSQAIVGMAARIRELEAEIAALKETRRGKLEVIPSKPPAPLPPGARRT